MRHRCGYSSALHMWYVLSVCFQFFFWEYVIHCTSCCKLMLFWMWTGYAHECEHATNAVYTYKKYKFSLCVSIIRIRMTVTARVFPFFFLFRSTLFIIIVAVWPFDSSYNRSSVWCTTKVNPGFASVHCCSLNGKLVTGIGSGHCILHVHAFQALNSIFASYSTYFIFSIKLFTL